MIPFRRRLPFEQRKREYENVARQKPGFIPIIMEKGRDAPMIDKEKYLVPPDFSASQFACVVRKRLHMKEGEALFFHCGDRVVTGSASLSSLHAARKEEDNFLYLTYSLENAFGR